MNPSLPSPAIVAILAGGKARRFGGRDKGEILIDGQRLIDIIYERLKSQSDEVIISGPHDYDLGLEITPDVPDAPGGPVGGLYSIWESLKSRDIEGFFTVAVDGPNLPDDLIELLYIQSSSAVTVDEAGRHPTYGWWRMCDLSKAWQSLERTESISLNQLADLARAKNIIWDGREAFLNINRQMDLERFVKGT